MAQNERLQALTDAGVAVWLDQIHREMIESGDLKALVDEKSLRGETSNPAIFEKAIMGGDAYDDKIEKFAGEGLDARETYLRIAIEDVQAACDVMRPVYDSLDHYDGFVSLEVEPALARDTDATLEQAQGAVGGRGPAQRDDQDPGHPRGRAGDRGRHGRRHERERDAAVQRRGLRGHRRGVHPRHGAAQGGRGVAGRALGGVVLRLARGHRGGQAPGGRRQGGPDRPGRHRQRAGRLPVVQAHLPWRPVRRAQGGGRAGAAAVVGIHRRQGRALRRHQVRGRPGGTRDGEHHAAGHARGLRRASSRSRATPPTRTPRRRCRSWPTPASTWAT